MEKASREATPKALSRKIYSSPQLVEYGNAMKLVRGTGGWYRGDDGNGGNAYYNS